MFIAVYAPRSADSRKKLGKMFGEKFRVGKVTKLYNAREKEAKASPGYAPAGKVGFFLHMSTCYILDAIAAIEPQCGQPSVFFKLQTVCNFLCSFGTLSAPR